MLHHKCDTAICDRTIEKEIVKKIESEIIDKKPFIVKVKEWLDKRKQLKEEKLLGKIG